MWKCLVFFRKNLGACYLIGRNQSLKTCRMWNEGLLIRFLVHGKSTVIVFG